jgi:hypothetical protein
MHICYFDIKRNTYSEFVLPKQTANQEYYLQVLECLQQCIHRKIPNLSPDN